MSTAERIERLRAALNEAQIDALLVSQPENRRYMSGFTGSAGSLLISKTDAILATDFRYTEQAGKQAPDFEIHQITGATGTWLPEMLKRVGEGKEIGFESEHVTYASHRRITEAAINAKATLTPIEGLVERLRFIKDEAERASLLRAIQVTDQVFQTVASSLEPGTSEHEVAWQIERTMRELGAESIAFDLIVASGPNGAMAHHHPSEEPIAAGVPIVIDIGARVDGYNADMTRTIVLGEPDDQFRKIYDIVLTAQETAIATIEAGLTGDQADALARNIIEQAGYGETFGHSLGHGVGLEVHEFPRLGRGAPEVLENGMIFTVEPGIYITGWGGVRIEDVVELRDGRCVTLSAAPKYEGARSG